MNIDITPHTRTPCRGRPQTGPGGGGMGWGQGGVGAAQGPRSGQGARWQGGKGAGSKRGRVVRRAGWCGGHQERSRLLRPPTEAVERVVGELRVEDAAREGDEEEGARGGAQQRARLGAEELAQSACLGSAAHSAWAHGAGTGLGLGSGLGSGSGFGSGWGVRVGLESLARRVGWPRAGRASGRHAWRACSTRA